MKHSNRIVIVGLTTLMGAACTGSHDAASSSASNPPSSIAAAADQQPAATADGAILDACALVTQADAESILGVPAKLSEREKDDKHASHCSYEAVDQSKGFNNLGVEIHTDEDANEARTGLEINRKMYASNTAGNVYVYEALSGIGDDAFLVTNKTPEGVPAEMSGMLQDQQMLFLVKGGKDIEMTASYTGKARSTDSLKVVAKKLADHF
jgi:hypothetical protein